MLAIQSKKTNCDIKVTEIEKKITDHKHDKHITTPKFNKLTAENFAARLSQVNLVTKTDFNSSLNKKITSNKTKHLTVENELKNQKHLIQSIFEVKVILKIMAQKLVCTSTNTKVF